MIRQNAPSQNTWQQASPAAAPAASAAAAPVVPAPPVDKSWFIPGDFDTSAFLANATAQFIEIQAVWDSGELTRLTDYMTEDLVGKIKPELIELGRAPGRERVCWYGKILGVVAPF